MTSKKKFLISLLLFVSIYLIAQPNYPAPSGVWCSCPPTTGVGNGSVDPTVVSKLYVKGILVRVVWKDIETSDNVYNWTLIDNQIAAAQSYNKKISLAVGSGLNSPNWLYPLGVQSISYTVPFSGTIPVPWNTIFLNKWTEFIGALGNRYANDTTIQLVYMTNSSTNGFEMQLPFNPTPSYSSIGYTDQKVIDSWKTVIDAFDNAFPNHYLTNDFHPVNSSNTVADSVYSYAKQTIGSRYGANGWWWTQNNTSVYSSQYSILQDSSANNLFTGIQMAYSGVTSPTSFGTGGMPTALTLAMSNNICYWEIWNTDITSGTFDSLLSTAVCPSLSTLENEVMVDNLIVYPNPSSDFVSINLKKDLINQIELINNLGQLIHLETNIQKENLVLDLNSYTSGVYFLKMTNEHKEVIYKRIVIEK